MSPVIEKTQFKNMTDGWIGAVTIGPKGEDRAVAVEPGGHVWLSEEEQILTANAPRRASDNPFLPQTYERLNNETGENEEYEVTPLVPDEANRYVPANARPIPADLAEGRAQAIAQASATGDEPVVPVAVEAADALTRHGEVEAEGETAEPGRVSSRAQAAALAARSQDEQPAESVPVAEIPEEEVAETPPAPEPTPPAPEPTPEPPAPEPTPEPVPETEEPPVTEEETAAVSPGPQSEETGAAQAPQGEAVAGQFSPGEEVGTPEAPQTPPSQE